MRVALDTNPLFTSQAGIPRYIRGLMGGFQLVKPPNIEILPFAWEVENFEYQQPQRALKTFYRERFWSKWIAPRQLRKAKADLFHSTGAFLVVPPRGIVSVATLCDLAVFRFPERFRRWHLMGEKQRAQRFLGAKRVICISKSTADEAMGILGILSEKIEVIHPGCEYQPDPSSIPETKPDAALPAEFFLFVGSLEPGKNLALLKEVYALAKANIIHLPPLVVVGARWMGVAGEGSPPQDWHYLGRIPDPELVYLYRRARALLFPSKYEGFGFPVVEAMSMGCPVICSRTTSLPEVGGDAALYAELEAGPFLSGIRQILDSKALVGELVAGGLEQAKQFRWDKCTKEVCEVYRGALE